MALSPIQPSKKQDNRKSSGGWELKERGKGEGGTKFQRGGGKQYGGGVLIKLGGRVRNPLPTMMSKHCMVCLPIDS